MVSIDNTTNGHSAFNWGGRNINLDRFDLWLSPGGHPGIELNGASTEDGNVVLTAGVPAVISMAYAAGTPIQTNPVWLNGTQLMDTVSDAVNLTPATSDDSIVMGVIPAGGACNLHGHEGTVSEVLVYATQLSSSDFAFVNAYLKSKYGL